jgi:peptide/nickel transport system substrate-binding protein
VVGQQPVTLKIGLATPPPGGLPGVGISNLASYLTSEQLVTIGWDGRPTAKLATSWQVLPDGSVKFQLQPGAKFHDGSPVTAAAIEESVRTLLEQNRGGWVSVESVREILADGPNTIIIRLLRPEPFLLLDLANSSVYHPTKPDVGFGPYKLIERDEANQRVRLEAFDEYYRGKPAIRFVEIQGYQEQRSAWTALMRDEIDAVHEITPGAIDFAKADDSIVTFPVIRPYYLQLAFNLRHPILRVKEVRQALSQAVDREQVVDLVLNKQGVVADGPVWPFHWAYSTAQRPYKLNREAAGLRLDAAGFPMKAAAKSSGMPSRLRFSCLTVAESRYEKLAIILQKQLYEIGVDMQIEALPLGTLVRRLQSGKFDAFLLERTSGRSLNWTYTSFHSKYFYTGYTAADSVLDRLRGAQTDQETRAAVAELQNVLHDDPPGIFLAWPQVARAVSTRFVVPSERGRDVIGTLWQWRPAAARP